MSKSLQSIADQPSEVALPNPAMAVPSFQDIVLPRLYLQSGQSGLVDAGVARKGDLMLGNSNDDLGAVKIAGYDLKLERAYVLASSKTAAISTDTGPDFASARGQRDPSNPDSWDVWFYDLYIPEFEPTLPVRWMLWKTAGRPAYQALNTLILRAQQRGDTDPICVKIAVIEKSNKVGIKYPVCQVSPGVPEADELEGARSMAAMARELSRQRFRENDAPEPVAQPDFS